MLRAAAFLALGTSPLLLLAAGEEPGQPKSIPPRQMEKLGRGVVAVHQGGGKVFVSWRLLGTDPDGIAFGVYRAAGDGKPVKLTKEPLAKATCFTDTGVEFANPVRYFVRPVLSGKEGDPSAPFTLPAGAPARPYLSVPLKTLPGHTPNDAGVGDLDGDGRDEVVYGSCVIGSDGKGVCSTGLGHGDAMHLGDLDPDRPGLEVFKANGDTANKAGIQLRDARTGKQVWGVACTGAKGVGRACALDIDPRHRGMEMWGKGEDVGGLFNAKGEKISDAAPRTCNMGCWWDGDLLRELLDGVNVSKWDYKTGREERLFSGGDYGAVSNNGTKANPCLCADVLGDWREEIIARTRDGKELRIFCTTIPTEYRFSTLMRDPVYRLGVAWQNVGYNQPAHTGFYLGHGMTLPPPKPNITTSPAKP